MLGLCVSGYLSVSQMIGVMSRQEIHEGTRDVAVRA